MADEINETVEYASEGPLVDQIREIAEYYFQRLPVQSGGVKVVLEYTIPRNNREPFWRSQVEDLRQNVVVAFGNEYHADATTALEGRIPDPIATVEAQIEQEKERVAALESQRDALLQSEQEGDIHDAPLPLVPPAEVVNNTTTPAFSTPAPARKPASAVIPTKKK